MKPISEHEKSRVYDIQPGIFSAYGVNLRQSRQRFLRPLTSARTMPFTRQALRKPPARAFFVCLAAHSHCNTQYCCFGFAAIHRKLCSLRMRSNATLLHRVCSAPRRVASTSRGTISGGKGQKQRVCVRPGRPFSSISIHKKVRFSLFPLNEKRPPNNVLGGRFFMPFLPCSFILAERHDKVKRCTQENFGNA